MARNVGQTDQRVRIVLGALAGVLSLGLLSDTVPGPTVLSPLLGIAAVGLIVTGVTGFCGLYAVLGIETCSADRQSSG